MIRATLLIVLLIAALVLVDWIASPAAPIQNVCSSYELGADCMRWPHDK